MYLSQQAIRLLWVRNAATVDPEELAFYLIVQGLCTNNRKDAFNSKLTAKVICKL